MYFNGNITNTNINNEFNNNKTSLFNKFKIPIIIGIIIIIVIIIIIIFSSNNNSNNIINPNVETYLVLSGDEVINITLGDDYIEPGFKAYNESNEDLTKDVNITTNLNIHQIGEYEITYTIGNITKTRKINIVEKEENLKENTYIYLNTVNNSVDMYLKVGEKYTEPGYKVYSTSGKNLNDSVKITGSVDTSKRGNYTLTYSLTDENNNTISVKRNVIVMGVDIKLSLKNNSNGKADINVVVDADYFDYLVLPDGTKVTKSNYTYTVSKNGTYKFTAYNKKGMVKSSSIEVKNIDITPPSINSCSTVIKNNKTTFNISSDSTDIVKYVVNNNSLLSYTKNSFTVNSVIENAKITAYDASNNKYSINCSYYYEQIKPKGNENIKYNESSDTLKVWIEKVDRSSRIDYFVTHIWVKDAYKQFKSQVPSNYGKSLVSSSTLFSTAIKEQKLTNKLAVAVNASGFVLKGVWGTSYYEINPKFNKTATHAMVISNGKIIRDLTDEKIPKSFNPVYGINKDGLLKYYSFSGADTNAKKKEIYQKIIDDGVLNTFTFQPVLVADGKLKSTGTARNRRQAICQIDKNNFLFITDVWNSNDRSGFAYKELGTYMISLGCKTGFNLDGGGSAALYIKSKNKTTHTTISNPGREIADIIYFHE